MNISPAHPFDFFLKVFLFFCRYTRAKDQHQNIKLMQGSQESAVKGRSDDISEAALMMEKMPADRIEKVKEIKRKVRDGTYHVDSEKIAEKILEKILANEM